jgi:hypothetical protein
MADGAESETFLFVPVLVLLFSVRKQFYVNGFGKRVILFAGLFSGIIFACFH